MTTDLLEAKQHGPEKATLEQVEEYQQEVLKERSFFLFVHKAFPHFYQYFNHKHSEGF